jgi:hypothetical protein
MCRNTNTKVVRNAEINRINDLVLSCRKPMNSIRCVLANLADIEKVIKRLEVSAVVPPKLLTLSLENGEND